MEDQQYKEILKQAQQILYCTTCGRTYQLDEIRLRGFLDQTVILQTICSNHHAPVVTFYLTNSATEKTDKPAVITSPAPKHNIRKVTKDDVLDLHEGLKGFDGNFKKLWDQT